MNIGISSYSRYIMLCIIRILFKWPPRCWGKTRHIFLFSCTIKWWVSLSKICWISYNNPIFKAVRNGNCMSKRLPSERTTYSAVIVTVSFKAQKMRSLSECYVRWTECSLTIIWSVMGLILSHDVLVVKNASILSKRKDVALMLR